MSQKSFGEEVAGELAAKTIMWGPAVAGAVLLGPVGVFLGLLASVTIVASASSSSEAPDSNQAPGS